MSHLLGVHKDMPASEYHALSGFIGSSPLMEMDRSPRHFQYAWTGKKKDPSAAMVRGTMIHSLLLEQDIEHYVPRPINEKGDLVRSNSKEYAEFLAQNPGKMPIHPDDFEAFDQMLTAFCENRKALEMYDGTRIEHSILAQDPDTGLYLKARPDIWGSSHLADLKSTSKMPRFESEIFSRMYDVRIAHYLKTIEYSTGEIIDQVFFIAYESAAPYGSRIFRLKPVDLECAKAKWRTLINQVLVCMKNNKWPCYSDEIQPAEKPKFIIDETISFDEVV